MAEMDEAGAGSVEEGVGKACLAEGTAGVGAEETGRGVEVVESGRAGFRAGGGLGDDGGRAIIVDGGVGITGFFGPTPMINLVPSRRIGAGAELGNLMFS